MPGAKVLTGWNSTAPNSHLFALPSPPTLFTTCMHHTCTAEYTLLTCPTAWLEHPPSQLYKHTERRADDPRTTPTSSLLLSGFYYTLGDSWGHFHDWLPSQGPAVLITSSVPSSLSCVQNRQTPDWADSQANSHRRLWSAGLNVWSEEAISNPILGQEAKQTSTLRIIKALSLPAQPPSPGLLRPCPPHMQLSEPKNSLE
ncbi:hypothetical protein Bbelb_346630 [Branchiostoma belcheri]|nr:hypothetical protein Bbelb_346630 [Branchiostoma belcheri]